MTIQKDPEKCSGLNSSVLDRICSNGCYTLLYIYFKVHFLFMETGRCCHSGGCSRVISTICIMCLYLIFKMINNVFFTSCERKCITQWHYYMAITWAIVLILSNDGVYVYIQYIIITIIKTDICVLSIVNKGPVSLQILDIFLRPSLFSESLQCLLSKREKANNKGRSQNTPRKQQQQ